MIFVVPKGLGNNFRQQEIKFPKTWTANETEIFDCIKIPGIGNKKSEKLLELGIKNSAQLLEAYNCQDVRIKFVKSSVEKWIDEMNLKKRIDNGFLVRIPQYVMEVESSLYGQLNSTEKR